MLSPAPMRWFSVVVLERDLRPLLRSLGGMEIMQLAREIRDVESAPGEARDRDGELIQCDKLLARAAELRRKLQISEHIPQAHVDIASLARAEESLGAMEQRAETLMVKRNKLQHQASEATALYERLQDFQDLQLPIDQDDQSAFLHFVVGRMPNRDAQALRYLPGSTLVFLPVSRSGEMVSFIALGRGPTQSLMANAPNPSEVRTESLPTKSHQTIHQLADHTRLESNQALDAYVQVDKELRTLIDDAGHELTAIERAIKIERILLEAEGMFTRTDSTVLITGWVPEFAASELANRAIQITAGSCAINIERAPDIPPDEIPVLLRSWPILRPFARIVTSFGSPKYGELSPTIFVALSSLAMFGMMFGDVGHGLMLLAAGLVPLLSSRFARWRDAGLLLMFGGGISCLFGMIYGSYFGIVPLKRFALWRDPLEGSPAALMYLALTFGIAVISLGLLLNIINRMRQREFLRAFADRFGISGVVFYWGGLVLIWQYPLFEHWGVFGWAVTFFAMLPLFTWMLCDPIEHLVHGRKHAPQSGWSDVIAKSVVGAFEAVLLYFANTVSFVRLAAYAMSHAALLVATFFLAGAVQSDSLWGTLTRMSIILFGNLLAICLEGVIACVQTIRLEYYEFFSKFFSGQGRPFQPFRLAPGGDYG